MEILNYCSGCQKPIPFNEESHVKAKETFNKFWSSKDLSARITKIAGAACLGIGLGILVLAITAVALKAIIALSAVFLTAAIGLGTVIVTAGAVSIFISWLLHRIKDNLTKSIQLKQFHSIEKYEPSSGDKPIALVIQSESDHNGALTGSFPKNLEPHYKIVSCTAKEGDDIIASINKVQNEKIGLLWIQAHGLPTSFVLSSSTEKQGTEIVEHHFGLSTKVLDTIESKPLLDTLNSLPKNAPIVLESCSTGSFQNRKKVPGLARKLSEKLNDRMIFAPKRESIKVKVKSEKKSLGLSMQDWLLRDIKTCYVNGKATNKSKLVRGLVA
jgi:hypothetical protein